MTNTKITQNLKQYLYEEFVKPLETYEFNKIKSLEIDQLLDFKCQTIEDALLDKEQENIFSSSQQFWYGLEVQSMQTPYLELADMIRILKPGKNDTWIDLGAAYGRLGIVINILMPEMKFIGYEFVQNRVTEGNRIYSKWAFNNSQLIQADISTDQFNIEEADLYFIYDFGSQKDIYRVLEKLRIIALKKPIKIIARGRGVKNWILMDFPWLYDINPPEHYLNWSLFRS